MANEQVSIKRGLKANIPDTKVAGQILVATDTGEMFIDDSSSSRIQINASIASKLSTSAGSATQPVYFNNGIPVATTYTLGKSVPSNAVFTDTVYTLPLATSSVRGGVKIGYTQSGKNYPVQLSNEQMYVNVPWTDTNTTYTAGTGLSLSGTAFSVKLGYTTSGKNYKVTSDTDGNLYVNVPWTDTNTTYSAMTGATSSAAGTAGLVPAPAAGKQTSFLRGDGTWVVPTNTDTKVTQSASISTNGNYPVLLGYSTATTAVTNTVNKSSKLLFNPSTGKLTATTIDATMDDGSID